MAVQKPDHRPLLPIVPAEVLRKHSCLERHDNRFRACARLLQSCWRTEQSLPLGTHIDRKGRKRRLGSLLATSAAETGRNFLTPEISRLARRAVAYQEPGALIDRGRLFSNLLSSMPLCFNAFGPLALDLDVAATTLRRLFPQLDIHGVTKVMFEHSPGRLDPELTNDRSAFDVAIQYLRSDRRQGMIVFEVKYSESLNDAANEPSPHLDDLGDASGLFKHGPSALLHLPPLHQLFREHLLAQATVMRGDWNEATFVLLAPANNHLAQRAAELYAHHLKAPIDGQVPFVNLSLESFIAALAHAGAMPYASALYDRYCAWWKLDELVDQALETKTQQWSLRPLRPADPLQISNPSSPSGHLREVA